MAEDAKRNGVAVSAPASAPGQALGYGLQYTRLTAILLEAPEGSACSLEVLDDVAEQSSDGKTRLIQTKSALTDNPVADRAISLWKAVFNWCELVKRGLTDPDTTIFELYVSRPVDGSLVGAIHRADSLEAARTVLELVRKEFWGEAPGFKKKVLLPRGLRRYVNPVLETRENILLPIIVNLRLKCGSGSPQGDIEATIRRGPVSESKVCHIADYLSGWVKRRADLLLEVGLPAVISRDEFHAEYIAYARRIDRDSILESFAPNPSDEERLKHLPSTFVRQLDLIELSFDDKLAAISDYLRACWDRTHWSKTGDVHEKSFAELDDTLCRVWKNRRQAADVEAAARSVVERGRLVHARCMDHQAPVQGMDPPPHFVPGCFHRLADELVIGWHPTYRVLLEAEAVVTS